MLHCLLNSLGINSIILKYTFHRNIQLEVIYNITLFLQYSLKLSPLNLSITCHFEDYITEHLSGSLLCLKSKSTVFPITSWIKYVK